MARETELRRTTLWMNRGSQDIADFGQFEADAAKAEGWCLSARDDGFFEIQRRDDVDPAAPSFPSDFAAYAHVRAQAEDGSLVHQAAIQWHGLSW